ncbi:ATP-binding cassette domain-containing protein [Natrialba swarupiae]|nr:ATP-binding cassette domain-containing protein [Natrialba swarupiae]
MPALTVDNLTKSYGQTLALSELSFEVEREVFGFLGPNGAGKSTTINVVLDFIRPTAGQVEVLGMNAQTHSRDIRARTGVLPEGVETYDRLTAREHLEFAIESKGRWTIPKPFSSASVCSMRSTGKPAATQGMSQRLMLAMALVGEPDLLILDEPSTGLDPNGAREMREIVREENDRGATVFSRATSWNRSRQSVTASASFGTARWSPSTPSRTSRLGQRGRDPPRHRRSDRRRRPSGSSLAPRRLERGRRRREPTATRRPGRGSKTAVLGELEERGIEIEDFSTTEASLDEVFQTYTASREVQAQ